MSEPEKIEPEVKVEIIGHRDGCTYPETQMWCEFHAREYWEGRL